jgi:hypothetical protein
MVEVQAHGFSFEKWVRDHFFSGYQGTDALRIHSAAARLCPACPAGASFKA